MKYEVLIGIKGKLELHQVNALYLQDRMMMEREREREREKERALANSPVILLCLQHARK